MTEINVRDYGAVGDCTAPDTGTDDGPAFQDAIDDWVTRPGSVLVVPEGRYRIATALEANFGGEQFFALRMDGEITPDTDLPVAWKFHNGENWDFRLRVDDGGATADFSARTPGSGGTECFWVENVRWARLDIEAMNYRGRVLHTTRATSDQNTRARNLDIKIVTGNRPGAGFARTGQVLYADANGFSGGSSAWGRFTWRGEGSDYGPVFEDLNDVHIGEVEAGDFVNSGVEFRGVRAAQILGAIYLGEVRNDNDGIKFVRSTTALARKCAQIRGNIAHVINARHAIVFEDFDPANPAMQWNMVGASDITGAVLKGSDTKFVNVGCVNFRNAGSVLDFANVQDFSVGVDGRDIKGDGIITNAACDRGEVHGSLADGAAGKSMVAYYGTGNITLGLFLKSANVNQLVYIDQTGTNGLRLIGGGLYPQGSATKFNSGRAPNETIGVA